MKTQLLCTFTKRNRFYETIDIIIACNDICISKWKRSSSINLYL
jgi:hypothetical protein